MIIRFVGDLMTTIDFAKLDEGVSSYYGCNTDSGLFRVYQLRDTLRPYGKKNGYDVLKLVCPKKSVVSIELQVGDNR